MFNRIHQKLGTAGFIISIVALVAALGGGAYAASGGLSGKQKKEVEKIAKKFSGKPGAAGATGPAGPAGKEGGAGKEGAPGANGTGTAGAAGESVTIGAASAGECPSGGAKFTNKTGTAHACSAAAGGGFPKTLPEGATETGTWEGRFEHAGAEGNARDPISFNVPLEAAIGEAGVHYVPLAQQGQPVAIAEGCPGTGEAPEAEKGTLCVYEAFVELLEPTMDTIGVSQIAPPGSAGFPQGAGVAGAMLLIHFEGAGGFGEIQGSWAVTG
jgi:hypothetical protein